MPDARQVRIAENESRFREINDRLERDVRGVVEPGEMLDVVCECGLETCREIIPIAVGDYEAVRGNPTRFVLVPGHDAPDVERVVSRRGAYNIVEKTGESAVIAAERDPRG